MKGIKQLVGTAHTQTVPVELPPHSQKLKDALIKQIRRSAYVYRVDCGGCNACEIEIFAATTPVFDAERFGIKVVASPRHADILLFTETKLFQLMSIFLVVLQHLQQRFMALRLLWGFLIKS